VHVAPQIDTLLELTKIRLIKLVAKLRLARQHDLEMFGVVGLEIHQEANLFENVVAQLVGFVDDYHCAKAAAMTLFENFAHRVE